MHPSSLPPTFSCSRILSESRLISNTLKLAFLKSRRFMVLDGENCPKSKRRYDRSESKRLHEFAQLICVFQQPFTELAKKEREKYLKEVAAYEKAHPELAQHTDKKAKKESVKKEKPAQKKVEPAAPVAAAASSSSSSSSSESSSDSDSSSSSDSSDSDSSSDDSD